ncbi:MAG: hypothetical protein KatS3mg020_0006 [Fimbriimonadales bacterium]|nr:MAG: hypothetical protein KatS3mg020_0006 [Fimbriimonadales bacterium]
MVNEQTLRPALSSYSLQRAIAFWQTLGYGDATLREPLEAPEFQELPQGAREPLRTAHLLYNHGIAAHLPLGSCTPDPAQQNSPHARNAESASFPQYEMLFTARISRGAREPAFYPPPPYIQRFADGIAYILRTLEVQPDAPTRTDLEVLLALETRS